MAARRAVRDAKLSADLPQGSGRSQTGAR
jgi:hypothetical protein